MFDCGARVEMSGFAAMLLQRGLEGAMVRLFLVVYSRYDLLIAAFMAVMRFVSRKRFWGMGL